MKACPIKGCRKQINKTSRHCQQHSFEFLNERAIDTMIELILKGRRKKSEIYRIKAWQKHIRKNVIEIAGGKCNICFVDCRVGGHVDHIVNWTDKESFKNLENMQLLCKDCHRLKTYKEFIEILHKEQKQRIYINKGVKK